MAFAVTIFKSQPASLEASRSRSSENGVQSGGTLIVARRALWSRETWIVRFGASKFPRNLCNSPFHSTMSMCSPGSSASMALTRVPRTPVQALTASTAGTFDSTAIIVRLPGSRAIPRISTAPNRISGTCSSRSLWITAALSESGCMESIMKPTTGNFNVMDSTRVRYLLCRFGPLDCSPVFRLGFSSRGQLTVGAAHHHHRRAGAGADQLDNDGRGGHPRESACVDERLRPTIPATQPATDATDAIEKIG